MLLKKMAEPISHLERALCVAMPMEELSEDKYAASTSTADKVDRIREKKIVTDFETKDSACEDKKLAAGWPLQIIYKRILAKYKILRNLRIQKRKRVIAKLEAKNKRFREEKAMFKETELELEAFRRLLREVKANQEGMKAQLDSLYASIFETDVKLDPIANVKSEVDISTSKPLLESFLEQIDANVKSQVDFSDFKIFEEDIGKDSRMVRRFNVPLCLAPISERIYEFFGDISSESYLSDCVAKPSYVLFCAAIKEMDDLKLEQVTKTKMLLWRDAINCALNVNFKVGFAKKHLKKIARAYFGLKAREEKSNDELREIAVLDDCKHEANYFYGKPLSTGLFH